MVIERYLPIWGGAENQLRQLCPRLVDLGCEVTIVTRRWTRDMTVREVIDGIPVRRVGPPLRNRVGTFCFAVALLWYLLREGRLFDVIHSHGAAALGALCSLSARLSKSRNVAKIATAGRIPELNSSLPGRLVLALFKRSDAFICLSREIYDELMAIKVSSDRILCIGNAVDGDRFKPALSEYRRRWRFERGFEESQLIVVFSGRLVPRKGPDILLKAWRYVVDEHPSVLLLLLGSGHGQADSIESQLHQVVEEEPIPNVRFEGSVEALETYLGAADILVLPSLREGFPNALLEAMAAGLATISSRIGGVEDLITDGVTGLTFPAADVTALADVLKRLLDDPSCRREIGRNARRHVLANYSIATISDRYVNTYKYLIQNKRLDGNFCRAASKKT